MRGGARWQPARRSLSTLSRLPRAPTKQAGPSRPHSAHALLRYFTPRPSGGREGSACEAAPAGRRVTRSRSKLNRRPRAPTKQAGPSRPHSAHALLRYFTPRPSGGQEGSACEAAPAGRRVTRSRSKLNRRPRAPTKQAGPSRPHSAHALLRYFTPRPSGGREGSACEAAPAGRRVTRSRSKLNRRPRAPTKQAGPSRPHSAHALLRYFTPRPSGGREGSACEAAPDGSRRGVVSLR